MIGWLIKLETAVHRWSTENLSKVYIVPCQLSMVATAWKVSVFRDF